MLPIFITGFLILIVIFPWFYLKKHYEYWKKRYIAGPEPKLFFGNIKESVQRQKHIANIFKDIYDQYPDEKVVGIFRLTSPALIVRDLDIVKHILIKDFHKFSERGVKFDKKGLGDNLFHADTDVWKEVRKLLTPMFTSGKLKNIVRILSHIGDGFVDHVTNEICMNIPEQELMSLFFNYNVATIMACSLGLDANMQDLKAYKTLNKEIFDISFTSELDMLFPGILRKTNQSIFGSSAKRFSYDVVEFFKNERNSKSTNTNNVMNMLLSVNNDAEKIEFGKSEISEQVMAGQIGIFFGAGYVNNTITLTYSLWHLALDQRIQENLIREISTVLKTRNNELTLETINEMRYLEMVFLETLRMHPTTNSVHRCAMEDYVIPETNIKIEKGTFVIIPPLAFHHDEKIYHDPGMFDPERFSTKNYKSRHACSFLSFGFGPRKCIGSRLATLQYKVCLIKFLMKYRVVPSTRTKHSYKIDPLRTIVQPEGGVYVNIIPRTKD